MFYNEYIKTFLYICIFYRYECFKQENAVNYVPIALLLFFSIIVSVVRTVLSYFFFLERIFM